jgi:hypothetical protein
LGEKRSARKTQTRITEIEKKKLNFYAYCEQATVAFYVQKQLRHVVMDISLSTIFKRTAMTKSAQYFQARIRNSLSRCDKNSGRNRGCGLWDRETCKEAHKKS